MSSKSKRTAEVNKALQHKNQQVRDVSQKISDLDNRVLSQHKLLTQILIVLKSYDAKIDTLKELSEKANIFTPDTFETGMDEKLGLRKKTEEETVQLGDTVWVNYTATDVTNAENKISDENFVLRAGSNTVVFEHELIGKKIGTKNLEFEATVKDTKLKFSVDILKAKARVDLPQETA
jgi:hypothetical protein